MKKKKNKATEKDKQTNSKKSPQAASKKKEISIKKSTGRTSIIIKSCVSGIELLHELEELYSLIQNRILLSPVRKTTKKKNQFFVDAMKIQAALLYEVLKKCPAYIEKLDNVDDINKNIEYFRMSSRRGLTDKPDLRNYTLFCLKSIYKEWVKEYSFNPFSDTEHFSDKYITPGKKLIKPDNDFFQQIRFIEHILIHIKRTEPIQYEYIFNLVFNIIKAFCISDKVKAFGLPVPTPEAKKSTSDFLSTLKDVSHIFPSIFTQ